MLRAVIFDFDGVVADSEFLHYKSLNEVFGGYGVDVSKEEHWAKYLGYSDRENIVEVSRDYGMGLGDDQVDEIIARKAEIFARLVRTETAIINGAAEFIGMLGKNNIRRAVCSGASLADITLMLDGSKLEDSFETIVAADHVKESKPDPEGYLLALERLNEAGDGEVLAGECVVIEDSHWGLEAAGAAGMHRVGVANTYSADELAGFADKVVDNLGELTIEDLQALCGD